MLGQIYEYTAVTTTCVLHKEITLMKDKLQQKCNMY
jgi:hypothetical protein